MTVTKAMLDEIIRDYGIRPGKANSQTRVRLAIIISEAMIKNGMLPRDAAILERAFYDELEAVQLVSALTDYEEFLKNFKGWHGIDPLKIGLPEGTAYSEDTREKVRLIIFHIERSVKNETGKSIDRRITLSGVRNKQRPDIGIKAKGLAVHPPFQSQAAL
jgi:hypothetical protein